MDVMTCYTEAGAALHLRCHILDITDRILTEERLARRTEELTLANARLRQINTDLQRLKGLGELVLTSTSVTPAGLRQLRAALPSCNVRPDPN